MYSSTVRRDALKQLGSGASLNATSKRLGIARSTLREWRHAPLPTAQECGLCAAELAPPPAEPYAHLLGLYLGDGCVSLGPKGVYSLRIACCAAYPRLIDECEASIRAVRPGPVSRVRAPGCVQVVKYWKHWPCLFPQHGPGRKHDRVIELHDWQRAVVVAHPGRFLRGLFHSDGCRVENWTVRTVAGERKRYTYPRYLFSNESADIMRLCQWALGLMQLRWTMPRPNMLSVARRADTAILDQHVGRKS